MGYTMIRGSELNLSKKFIKERREHINHLINMLRSSINTTLDHIEKGYWISKEGFDGTDSIQHGIKSIEEEIERNYNFKYEKKCQYCNEKFAGIMAYDRCHEHEWEQHRKECEKHSAIIWCLMYGFMGSLANNMAQENAEALYKDTSSKNAKQVANLLKKGKDVPSMLLKEYYNDWNEYYDKQDPKRKWHEPINTDKLTGNNTVGHYGDKSLWNNITDSVIKIIKDKKE